MLIEKLTNVLNEEKPVSQKYAKEVVVHYRGIGVDPELVEINEDLNNLFSEQALYMLKSRYLVDSDKGDPQKAFRRAVCALASNKEHAQRLYNYVSGNNETRTKWLSLATPIICNAGTKRGLPISCFLNYVDDSRAGILNHLNEISYLSTLGGGVGGHWSNIRSVGTKTSKGSSSSGLMPFIKIGDSSMLAWNQGGTRRGSCAAYLRIDHPEILEFIAMRKPTGGDINRKCLNMHHAVMLTDKFMEIIVNCVNDPTTNDDFNLIDPATKNVVDTVSAKMLWQELLTIRSQTGEPYLMFTDTCGRLLPNDYKRLGKEVQGSNLCSEVILHTSPTRSAVCCLSSLNLENFDEYKDNEQFFLDVVEMLDNAITVFIIEALDSSPYTNNAIRGAFFERSIGVGALGFHSALQKAGIPFESALATSKLHQFFSCFRENIDLASKHLAEKHGTPIESKTYRNVLRMAIAPNASSSSIIGTSPSLEPIRANIYSHETYNTSHTIINQHLVKLLEEKGKHTPEVIKSILTRRGSVQHLEFLDDYEKDIFKTAFELDQNWIVEHASVAQKYVDQAISTNLFFEPKASKKYVANVHLRAWKLGLKTLYYYRSRSAVDYDDITTKIEPKNYKLFDDTDCLACEG